MNCWTNTSGDGDSAAGHDPLGETVGLLFERITGWTNLHFLLNAAVFTVAVRATLSLQRAGFECFLERPAAATAPRATAATSALVGRSLRLVHEKRSSDGLQSLRRARGFRSQAGRLFRCVNS